MWAPDPAALPPGPLYRAALVAFLRIASIDRLSPATVAAWQRRRLRRLFGATALGEWDQRPPLEREQLRLLLEAEPAPAGGTVETVTSGSTGTPLRLHLPLNEYAAGLAALAFGFLMSGVRPGARVAHLCVPIGNSATPQRLGIWQVRRIDLRDSGEQIARTLNSFRPDVIYAYPSHLDVLNQAGQLRHVPAPRLVISNGEPLSERLRTRLAEVWGCLVLDTYGSVELPRVAFACAHGTLHPVHGAVLIEADPTTRDDEGFEDLLLTSLYHRSLPLARYRIGDRARLVRDHRCRCGRRGLAIAQLQGRCDDVLRLPGGRLVSPRAVSLLEHDPRVREFQVVQQRLDRFALRVVAAETLSRRDRHELIALVRRGLGDETVQIALDQVVQLPRTASGKRRAVVSALE